jgi:ABC-type transport system involved in multi-copper enzyme maturation permease subunit
MMAAIKAEFRKLLSVRSTYGLVGIAALFTLLYAGYIQGFRLTGKDLLDPNLLNNDVTGALGSLPIVLSAIVAILLMTHEYRYNTIMYSLTSSNSRSKVLFAKIVAVTGFALVVTAFIGVLSPLVSLIGIHLHGNTLGPQVINYASLIPRALFSGWSYIMAALLLAALLRNQIAAIVSLFAIPIVEQILVLLLKKNAVYLPFTAQGEVLTPPHTGSITYMHAAIVFASYLIVGWIVTWILFLRRDAN